MHRQELFTRLLADTLSEETSKKLYTRLDELPDEVLILMIDRLIEDVVEGEMSIYEKYQTLYQQWESVLIEQCVGVTDAALGEVDSK